MAHNKLIYQLVPLKIDLWIDLEHNSIIKLFTSLPKQIQFNLFDNRSGKNVLLELQKETLLV